MKPYAQGGICSCPKALPQKGGPYGLLFCGKCGHLISQGDKK